MFYNFLIDSHGLYQILLYIFLLQAIDRDVQELEKLKDPTGIMIKNLTN